MAMHMDLNGTSTPRITSYLQDPEACRFTKLLASRSSIPTSSQRLLAKFPGDGFGSARDSLEVVGTDFTSAGSLPYLSKSASTIESQTASAVSDVMARTLLNTQRLLPNDLDEPVRSVNVVLPCPFNFLRCSEKFVGNSEDWYAHSREHFNGPDGLVPPPQANQCCFCDAEFQAESGWRSWELRMEHVLFHYEHGHRVNRPDFSLVQYLWETHVIDQNTYRECRGRSDKYQAGTPELASDSSTSENSDDTRPVSVLNERRHRSSRRH